MHFTLQLKTITSIYLINFSKLTEKLSIPRYIKSTVNKYVPINTEISIMLKIL